MRLHRVDRDVHLRGDVRGIQHLADVAQHILFPAAELLHDHRGGMLRCLPLYRDGARHHHSGTEELAVPPGEFRIAHQHGLQPAPLHGEREPALLRLAQLQGLLK
jgi:hypothetical protein